MRRDFDYVTMDDYSSDMKETAQQAAAIISGLRGEVDHMKHLLALVLREAGTVNISLFDFENEATGDGLAIEQWYDDSDQTMVLRAKQS